MNEHWIGTYGNQYEIIDKVSDFGVSGAKQGRFDWFVTGLQKGEYEPGTLLLVERVSRFGRMKASQTIEQLQEIWKAGGITAFTDIDGGRPFGSEGLDSDSGLIFELFGAIRGDLMIKRGGMDVLARWTGHETVAPPASVEPVHGERSVATSSVAIAPAT